MYVNVVSAQEIRRFFAINFQLDIVILLKNSFQNVGILFYFLLKYRLQSAERSCYYRRQQADSWLIDELNKHNYYLKHYMKIKVEKCEDEFIQFSFYIQWVLWTWVIWLSRVFRLILSQ